MRTPSLGALLRAALLLVFALCSFISYSQYSCEGWEAPVKWNPLRQRVVTNQTVPGTGLIKNWLEFLPDDYNSSGNKKYPLMIFFHGTNEGGGGSPCRLLQGEWWWTPPVIIERRQFPYSSRDQSGTAHKFIVISPRLEWFGETSNTINSFIDHLISRYRVDPGRVYLTGISAGANFILQYAGLSEANSRKVAAIAPVAMCDVVNSQQATNISRGGLHVYNIKCSEDGSCGSANAAAANTNAINAINPGAQLAVGTTLPVPGWPCNSFAHDAWGTAYDSTFRQNLNGRNVNMYEWMLQFKTAASGPLPVDLESYSVTLSNGKVYVRWSTSSEKNSSHFAIERAGANQQFAEIATIPSAGNSGVLKTYEYVDEHPLSNVNYYRLTQTDRDGQKEIFETRKILNRAKWDRFAIASPNPFNEELSVYINVDKIQRVAFTLADMSGRIIRSRNGTYNEGTAEVKFDTGKLPRGVYFLKVEGEYFSEVQRVVKQ